MEDLGGFDAAAAGGRGGGGGACCLNSVGVYRSPFAQTTIGWSRYYCVRRVNATMETDALRHYMGVLGSFVLSMRYPCGRNVLNPVINSA